MQSSDSPVITADSSSEASAGTKRKTPSKKETENLAACHARNAIAPIKGDRYVNEAAAKLMATATQDYITRIVKTASSYAASRENRQNTIDHLDIIKASQEQPIIIPTYLLESDVPAPRKPRTRKTTTKGLGFRGQAAGEGSA